MTTETANQNNGSGLMNGLKIGTGIFNGVMGIWNWIDSKTLRTKVEALKSASKK
jgi:hypothetical protein